LLYSLAFRKVAAGFEDFGDVDLDRAFEVLLDAGLRVPVDLVLVVGVAER
jgi:hypothetical protein